MRRESIILMTLVCALVLIGIFVVYSASAVDVEAEKRLTRLFLYVVAGFIGLYTAAHFDYHRLREPILFRTIVIFSFTLLVLVLIPGIGDERGGAQRWIEVLGFSFQPSEFAKFALILLVAVKLADNQEQIQTFFGGFFAPALITAVFAGMVLLEKDLGTPVVMGAAVYVMMIMAGVRWRYLLPSLAPAFLAIYALSITSPHRVKRLTAFLDPWSHRDDYGYQLIKS
ncbi:MAG: FtsW/RodA/SpoVE family cell cycle protein, partial [Candidatus Hydrogenedentales bacterium]